MIQGLARLINGSSSNRDGGKYVYNHTAFRQVFDDNVKPVLMGSCKILGKGVDTVVDAIREVSNVAPFTPSNAVDMAIIPFAFLGRMTEGYLEKKDPEDFDPIFEGLKEVVEAGSEISKAVSEAIEPYYGGVTKQEVERAVAIKEILKLNMNYSHRSMPFVLNALSSVLYRQQEGLVTEPSLAETSYPKAIIAGVVDYENRKHFDEVAGAAKAYNQKDVVRTANRYFLKGDEAFCSFIEAVGYVGIATNGSKKAAKGCSELFYTVMEHRDLHELTTNALIDTAYNTDGDEQMLKVVCETPNLLRDATGKLYTNKVRSFLGEVRELTKGQELADTDMKDRRTELVLVAQSYRQEFQSQVHGI